MTIRYKTSLLNAEKYVLLAVHQYSGTSMSGTIYHSLYKEGKSYCNLIDLVRQIEEIFAATDYPSRCVERRNFKRADELTEPERMMDEIEHRLQHTKPLATFRIQIMHCYRGSWQGIVEDMESGEQSEFDSFLMLLEMIEGRLPVSEEGTLAPDLDIGTYNIVIKETPFVLKLLYKEYHTWQGILYWKKRKQQVCFRSYLEFLMLVAGAVNQK